MQFYFLATIIKLASSETTVGTKNNHREYYWLREQKICELISISNDTFPLILSTFGIDTLGR